MSRQRASHQLLVPLALPWELSLETLLELLDGTSKELPMLLELHLSSQVRAQALARRRAAPLHDDPAAMEL